MCAGWQESGLDLMEVAGVFDSLLNDKYTTTEEVKKIIDEYDRKKMVNDFSEQELIKLASFVLNYKKDKIYRATLEMAVQKVIEWQND